MCVSIVPTQVSFSKSSSNTTQFLLESVLILVMRDFIQITLIWCANPVIALAKLVMAVLHSSVLLALLLKFSGQIIPVLIIAQKDIMEI